MKILLIEPPKVMWFLMGEYLPPPLPLLQLAGSIRHDQPNVDVRVLDCQAEGLSWVGVKSAIEDFQPDIVGCGAHATCNVFVTARTLELAKQIDPEITTVTGGSHFTFLAEESLMHFPEIDFVVRGEGEITFSELVRTLERKEKPSTVQGVSFKHKNKVFHTEDRPFITDLDSLPFPAYDLVPVRKYHFAIMSRKDQGYLTIEGSRGCPHACNFCSQQTFWKRSWRTKSPKRIVDEIEFYYNEWDRKFFWFADDNFHNSKRRVQEICDEIIKRGLHDEVFWFEQARADHIVRDQELLPLMHKAGVRWCLIGAESCSDEVLQSYGKKTQVSQNKEAIRLLKEHEIIAQMMMIFGNREESWDTLKETLDFVVDVSPEYAIFMILTPFPGTELHREAQKKGWIEDGNWANYDMIHAIMPTEHLSRLEVQKLLFQAYMHFYGSWKRRIKGVLSKNPHIRLVWRNLAGQHVLNKLKTIF